MTRVLESRTFGGTYHFGHELGKGATATVYKIKNVTAAGEDAGTYASK